MPAIPTEFPELKDLPLETLEQLEFNQTALDDYISKMPTVQKYSVARKEAVDSRNDLAAKNVALKARLDVLHDEVELIASRLLDSKERAASTMTDRDELMSKYTPKNLVKDLQKISATSDAETERILSEISDLDTAKSQVMEQRMKHHKARALIDLISAYDSNKSNTNLHIIK